MNRVISVAGSLACLLALLAQPGLAQTNRILHLDGNTNGGVAVFSPPPVLQLRSNHSICAWVKQSLFPASGYPAILTKYEATTGRIAYVYQYLPPYYQYEGAFGDGWKNDSFVNAWQTNVWYHLAFTHDGTVGRWYVNGQPDSVTTNGSIHRFGNGPLFLGNKDPTDGQNNQTALAGDLDEISLWTKTLSASEVAYCMTNSLSGNETNLAAYWNFDDGTASDLTTNNNDGALLPGASIIACGPSTNDAWITQFDFELPQSASNLLMNPGFEQQGSSPTAAQYWTWGEPNLNGSHWGSAIRENWWTYTNDGPSTYAHAIQGYLSGTNTGGFYQEAAAITGMTYTFSAYLWADASWSAGYQVIKLEFLQGQIFGTTMVFAVTNMFNDVGEAWTQKSLSATCPAGANWVRVVAEVWLAGCCGSLQFDNCSLVMSSPPSQARIVWQSEVGQTYSVRATTNLLNPNWTNVYSVPGNGQQQVFMDTNAATQFFYGLQVTNNNSNPCFW